MGFFALSSEWRQQATMDNPISWGSLVAFLYTRLHSKVNFFFLYLKTLSKYLNRLLFVTGGFLGSLITNMRFKNSPDAPGGRTSTSSGTAVHFGSKWVFLRSLITIIIIKNLPGEAGGRCAPTRTSSLGIFHCFYAKMNLNGL